jgi:tRNA(Ile)-lysidine synthase
VTATLAGARIEADDEEIRFMREAGETARGGMAPLALPSGVPTVWDGRFELTAHGETRTILPLAGLAARLSQAARRALSEIPRGARGALPAVVDDVGQAACPLLEPISGLAISALAHQRLLAACGAITREPG